MILGSFLPPAAIRYILRYPLLVRAERSLSFSVVGILMRMVLLAHE